MLTLFTTAKPFRGHIAVIQRNALQSWKQLHPDAEVILFGDDEGSPEVCREFGLRHEPEVARTSFGTIRVDDMFARAQTLARHNLLCYINCDIILMSDFRSALERVTAWRSLSRHSSLATRHFPFLMVGRRWDLDITQPIDFSSPGWQEQTRGRALAANHQRNTGWIDYFAFSRGLYAADLPPLAIGRTSWDNWLVWKVLAQKKAVIDASRVVFAIHQNHDYNHHPQGARGVWGGEESRRNYLLSGGWRHFRSIADATDILTTEGIKPNAFRRWSACKRVADSLRRYLHYQAWHPVWFAVLDATRPLRTVLGLRSQAMRRSRRKI